MKAIPTSNNKTWGFYGTMGTEARKAWPLAMNIIVKSTGQTPEAVRDFLDSVYGRHFADAVKSKVLKSSMFMPETTLEEAIAKAVVDWGTKMVGHREARCDGLKYGMNLLAAAIVKTHMHSLRGA